MIFCFVSQQNLHCLMVFLSISKFHPLLSPEISCALGRDSVLGGLAPRGPALGWISCVAGWQEVSAHSGPLIFLSSHSPFSSLSLSWRKLCFALKSGTRSPVCSPYIVMPLSSSVINTSQELGSRSHLNIGFWKNVFWDASLKLLVKTVAMNARIRWLFSPLTGTAWPERCFPSILQVPSSPHLFPSWTGVDSLTFFRPFKHVMGYLGEVFSIRWVKITSWFGSEKTGRRNKRTGNLPIVVKSGKS